MNSSASNEINGSTTTGGATGNSSRHAPSHTTSGSNRRTARSVHVTPKHSSCASSTPEGTINSGYFALPWICVAKCFSIVLEHNKKNMLCLPAGYQNKAKHVTCWVGLTVTQ